MRIESLNAVKSREFISFKDGVNVISPSPLCEVFDHGLDFVDVELSCPAKTQDVSLVEHELVQINDARDFDPALDFLHTFLLIGGQIAREATVLMDHAYLTDKVDFNYSLNF